MFVCIYIHVCVCVCVCIYIYIFKEERRTKAGTRPSAMRSQGQQEKGGQGWLRTTSLLSGMLVMMGRSGTKRGGLIEGECVARLDNRGFVGWDGW